jgi:membrane protein implicated in regulation of membrane protease activity
LIDALFESAVLVFTVPMLLAVLFWLLALIGLFDFEAFDFDLDTDLDVETDLSGSVLHAFGLGLIPFSLMLTILLFVFGFTGLALHTLLGDTLGWGAGTATLVFVPVALMTALAVGAGAGRLLHPLFRDHGTATTAHDLVGKIAVLTSGSVSPTFGAASVQMDGALIEIAARTESDANGLGYGDRVLLIDYDPACNLYLVAPFDGEDALPAS